MRRTLERRLRRLWTGEARGIVGALGSALTLGPELLFRLAVGLRDRSYRWGWRATVAAPIPVVSVGNLHVGGTGKTPFSAWLASLLRDGGWAPAVLLRGYGRDEVELHRRWNPDLPLYVGPDRVAGAKRAAADGRDVVVLDDGFQHRRLERDLDLVLLPAEGPWTRRLLPRGPLREPLRALRRADLTVVIRRTEPGIEAKIGTGSIEAKLQTVAPELPVVRAALLPLEWRRTDGAAAPPPSGPVLAFAGIARPDLFARTVAGTGATTVELAAFPDHHRFTVRDLNELVQRAEGRPLVTTEKDAIRLNELAGDEVDLRVLHLRVEIERERDTLVQALQDLPSVSSRAGSPDPRPGPPLRRKLLRRSWPGSAGSGIRKEIEDT